MRRRLHISLLVCGFALTLAGCGSSDDGTIPPGEADDLLAVLAAVEKYADEGNCDLAQQNAAELINQVNALPNDVDPQVAGELTKASDHLRELASNPDQCTETGASGIEGLQTTTDTTDTVEPPETTVTETTTPEEETTTEEQTDEQPPEEQNTEPPGGQGQDEGNQGGGQTEGGGVEPSSGGVAPAGGGG